MEQYRKPNPHVLEHCQNEKDENIGLANPGNDQILVVRRNILDRKFVYLSKHFDQITNLNG